MVYSNMLFRTLSAEPHSLKILNSLNERIHCRKPQSSPGPPSSHTTTASISLRAPCSHPSPSPLTSLRLLVPHPLLPSSLPSPLCPPVPPTSLWGASYGGCVRREAWCRLAKKCLQPFLPGQVIPSSIQARLPSDGRAAGHNIRPQATAEARPCAPAPATIALHPLRNAHAV